MSSNIIENIKESRFGRSYREVDDENFCYINCWGFQFLLTHTYFEMDIHTDVKVNALLIK